MPFKTGSWGEKAKARSRSRTAYFLAYKKSHRKQVRARGRVEHALKIGTLKKEPCRDCGSAKVNAHHPDYDKPLEVIWLCPLHHRNEHKIFVPFQEERRQLINRPMFGE